MWRILLFVTFPAFSAILYFLSSHSSFIVFFPPFHPLYLSTTILYFPTLWSYFSFHYSCPFPSSLLFCSAYSFLFSPLCLQVSCSPFKPSSPFILSFLIPILPSHILPLWPIPIPPPPPPPPFSSHFCHSVPPMPMHPMLPPLFHLLYSLLSLFLTSPFISSPLLPSPWTITTTAPPPTNVTMDQL